MASTYTYNCQIRSVPGTRSACWWGMEQQRNKQKSVFCTFLQQVDVGRISSNPDVGDIPHADTRSSSHHLVNADGIVGVTVHADGQCVVPELEADGGRSLVRLLGDVLRIKRIIFYRPVDHSLPGHSEVAGVVVFFSGKQTCRLSTMAWQMSFKFEREREREREREGGGGESRYADRQTDRQTDRQADRQTDRQTHARSRGRASPHTHTHTHTPTHTNTHTHTHTHTYTHTETERDRDKEKERRRDRDRQTDGGRDRQTYRPTDRQTDLTD